jgi:predicted phage-related endonuclease
MSVVFANTNEISHEEWLQARTRGLGGSDAAVVLGLSKYKSLRNRMEKPKRRAATCNQSTKHSNS